jgi:hypothetical protein
VISRARRACSPSGQPPFARQGDITDPARFHMLAEPTEMRRVTSCRYHSWESRRIADLFATESSASVQINRSVFTFGICEILQAAAFVKREPVKSRNSKDWSASSCDTSECYCDGT